LGDWVIALAVWGSCVELSVAQSLNYWQAR
jgi:hypothetical protein